MRGAGEDDIFFPLETECHNLDQTDPEYRRYGQDGQASQGKERDAAAKGIITHLARQGESLQEWAVFSAQTKAGAHLFGVTVPFRL